MGGFPLDRYKKWILIVIVAVAAGIVIAGLVTSPSYKTEEPAHKSRDMTPPSSDTLMDRDFDRVIPVEELEVDTMNPQSLVMLGDKYFENRRFAQAIEIYEKVLELNPVDVDTYNDLGLAYHYTGKSSIAVDILKKGARIIPSYQRIWLSLGFILMSVGNNEEAKSALKEAVDLNPETDVGQEAKRMLGLLN
jgi:tetratricopeptide (TPR) repeat protein